MDKTIYIAMISACSAIFGAFVPLVISYFTKKKELENSIELMNKQYNNNQNTTNIEIKRREYAAFIDALQQERNTGNNFADFQNSVNKILLFANDKTASLINNYFIAICNAEISKQELTEDVHDESQCKIINAMRADLGVSNSYIDNIMLASYCKS